MPPKPANALLSADLALAGMTSVIPADQVVEAMYRVGRQLPMELRETAMGGIAATEAGREYARRLAEETQAAGRRGSLHRQPGAILTA